MEVPGADTVLVRHGDIGVKSGRVQSWMEETLAGNLESMLAARGVGGRVETQRGRLFVRTTEAARAARSAGDVFGVVSASPAVTVAPEMDAVGEGSSSNSSFEMASGMALSEGEDGVAVDWHTQADVFGKVAQMGQRVITPVANRVVKRFFASVQDSLHDQQLADTDADATDDDRGLVDRVLGRSDSTDS